MHDPHLSFQQRSMVQQGYQCFTPAELRQYEWGLRFTPTVCTSLTLLALFQHWWWLNFAVAALGIGAYFTPANHPMDWIYNNLVRHLFGAAKLPPNPLQRRLACLSAGVLNLMIGGLFLLQLPIAAYLTGAVLVTLQVIVITTHFCTLSWLYELGMRAMGRWEVPMSPSEAKQKLDTGAVLIDVRTQAEFTRERLSAAKNFPVDSICSLDDELKSRPLLLYCASGMRSQIATNKLRQCGATEVYDIGSLSQLQDLFGTEAGPCT